MTVLIEGKTKIIEDGGDGTVLVHSKDDITAGDGAKHDVLSGKAACSTRTTINVFELLERHGIRTHFVGWVDETTFRARNVRMIPLELVVRRVAVGSFLKRHPEVKEGFVFEELVFEVFEKDDPNHDPKLEFDFEDGVLSRYVASKPREEALMSKTVLSHTQFAEITPDLFESLRQVSIKTFEVLETAWDELGGVLFDFKIECGFDRETGELLVADVIDSDSWRLRFRGEQRDKQSYRDGSKSLPEIKKDFTLIAEASDSFI